MNNLFSPPVLMEILGYILIIITFYVNYLYMATRILFKKRNALYFVLLAGLLVVVTFSSPFVFPDLNPN